MIKIKLLERKLIDFLNGITKSTKCRGLIVAVALAPVVSPTPVFGQDQELQFTEFLIAGNYGYAYGIQPADIDKDGDMDITSSETDNGEIYLYQNDGKGNFKRHFIQVNETGCPERHALGDIDGDGDIDLMVAMNLDGDFMWFENQNDPNKLWQKHLAARYGASSYDPELDKKIHQGDGLVGRTAYDVTLADFDGDGDLDAAVSTWVGGFFAWLDNTGNPRSNYIGRGFKARMIEEDCGETRTIRAADFDGDGDMDLLGTSRTGYFVAWYENPGNPAKKPFIKHILNDKLASPVHGEPIDIDKDGDLDVVMAHSGSDAKIVWYENTGNPKVNGWPMHVIWPSFADAHAAIAADIDDDGDLDVVATSHRGPGKVAVFFNPGDPNSSKWKMQIVKNNWRSTNQPILADFNNDGRLDIAATADRGSNELRWWRNDGSAK